MHELLNIPLSYQNTKATMEQKKAEMKFLELVNEQKVLLHFKLYNAVVVWRSFML